MVTKHEDLTQDEEVNDSGQKLPRVSPKDGDTLMVSNGKFSIWRLTQAEVVNDNGRSLYEDWRKSK